MLGPKLAVGEIFVAKAWASNDQFCESNSFVRESVEAFSVCANVTIGKSSKVTKSDFMRPPKSILNGSEVLLGRILLSFALAVSPARQYSSNKLMSDLSAEILFEFP